MSDNSGQTQRAPGEELPPVFGLLVRAASTTSRITRTVILRLSRDNLVFKLLAAGALAIVIGVPVLSFRQSSNWVGAFEGLFAGLFLALLFCTVGLWLIVWARKSPQPAAAGTQSLAGELDRLLAPTLRELEILRVETIRVVKSRSVTRLPAGIAIAMLISAYSQWQKGLGFDLGELLMAAFVGALLGEGWAVWKPHENYRRQYKARVLPLLAKRFGDLTYKTASPDAVAKLRDRGILPRYDRARVEDEIAGTHHGMPVSIVEARLQRRQQKRSRVVFDGLLVQVGLPRKLTGTTAVSPDGGPLGNLKTSWRSSGLERVQLEDPRFEKRYEVYGTDQVEARALLTPAFMERFTALEKLSGMAPPGAIARGNLLTIALPKDMSRGDLLEPPPYWKPAGGQALVLISKDIEAVLSMVDSVIALDYWAAGQTLCREA
jgi:hypothetical protein